MRNYKLGLTILLSFFILSGYSSDVSKLIPVKKNNKWGYINATGKIVIPTIYDGAEEFDKYGYAIIKKGPKKGIIDRYNKKIIKEEYDDINVVDKNKILVKKGKYFGVVNLIKNTPIEFLYDDIETFENGFLKIRKDSLYGIVGKNGGLVSDPLFSEIKLANNFFICKQGEGFGVFNLKGEEVLEPKYEDIIATKTALFYKDKQNLWGGVDARGRQLIPKIYNYLQLIATNLVKTSSGGKYGLVSLYDGKQIFDTKLKDVYSVNDNLVVVQEGETYALYQSDGSSLTGVKYKDVRPLNGSIISYTKTGEKWGVIDYRGRPFLEEKYDHIGFYDYNMLKLVQNGEASTKYIPEKYLSRAQGSKVEKEQVNATAFFQNTVKNEEEDVDLALAQKFGWFQYGRSKLWGLRSKEGQVLMRPTFTSIKIYEDLNYTKVEYRYPTMETKKNHFISKVDGKVRFDVNTRYGIFNHETNKFAVAPKFWSINVEDFREGAYAHAMLEGGYPCLIRNDGHDVKFSRIIKTKDGKKKKQLIGYIGKFVDGFALVNYGGILDVSDDYSDDVVGEFDVALPDINTNIEKPYNYVVVTGGKWGYVDRKGNDVVRPVYEKGRDIMGGVFAVKSNNGLWGVINEHTDTLTYFKFSDIEVFDEELGLFKTSNLNNYYAMADKNGTVISEAIYEAIYDFSDGYARVRRDGKWTLIDDHGKMIVKPQFDDMKDYSEGLAPAKVGKKWGYIDSTGEFVIKPRFIEAESFSEGLAAAKEKSNSYGFINKTGESVIEEQFTNVTPFNDGVAVVKKDGLFGLMNNHGHWKIKPKFGRISRFDKNGYAIVGKTASGGPYGLIDTHGRHVLPLKYQEVKGVADGMVAIKHDGVYGFAHIHHGHGKVVVKPQYKDVHSFHEGLAAVYVSGLWGYIDKEGNMIVEPTYKSVHDFSEGMAVVADAENHSFVIEPDGSQHELTSLHSAHDFHEGVAVAESDNNTYYFMDADGNHIFNGDFDYADDFIHGLAVVQTAGKYGMVDHNGNYVLSPIYDKIIHLKSGNAIVKMNKLSGLISSNGLELLDPEYDLITKFDDEILRVEQSGKIGYTNSVGNWLWKPQK